jgi:hypothetical protein
LLVTLGALPALAQSGSSAVQVSSPARTVEVTPESVPASGAARVHLAVPAFGRYSIAARSKTGAAIEVVDRMAGSLGGDGEAGTRDGRLDLFLDRGEYLLRVTSPALEPAAGAARAADRGGVEIAVAPSVEQQSAPVQLVERRLVESTLGDHQERSWWFELGERQAVFLEAGGRDLAALALWQDGGWRVDAEPRCSLRQPVVGRPIRYCRLEVDLPAGLYRLAAYGGAPLAWAAGGDEHPLYLRRGLPRLPVAGRAGFVAGPLGTDRFLVDERASFFRLELPASGAARLRVGKLHGEETYFSGAQQVAFIAKNSVPPAVEFVAPASDPEEGDEEFAIEAPKPAEEEEVSADEETTGDESEVEAGDESSDESGEEEGEVEESAQEEPPARAANASALPDPHLRWVEVAATPGQSYTLQQFEPLERYALPRGAKYWIGGVEAGFAADAAPLTAVLVELRHSAKERDRWLAESAPRVDLAHPWGGRFNVFGETNLFVRVDQAGKYELQVKGAATRYRLEPFFTSPPKDYKQPAARAAGKSWDLDPGLWVLTLLPDAPGVADVALAASGQGGAALLAIAAGTPPAGVKPFAPAGRLGAVDLAANRDYVLYFNHRPEVTTGMVVRPVPIALSTALPIDLGPGEELDLPVAVPGAGVLKLSGEGSESADLALAGGAAGAAGAREVAVQPATASVHVANRGTRRIPASLEFVAAAELASAPLPVVPPERLAAIPEFTPLDVAHPVPFELARLATRTFALAAGEPALYHVESTGLLATEGTLRTRTQPGFASESGNGVGRNFRVSRYLREGDYQVTVAAVGQSTGHLAVRLAKTALADGGPLALARPARARLAANEGIAWRIPIAREGVYRIRALGPGFLWRARLEDAEGYPLAATEIEADTTVSLAAGDYRLVLLPRDVASRAVALVEAIEAPERGGGHAVVALALGRAHRHLWEEPESGERAPDLYAFTLPAAATLDLALDGEMQATLTPAAGGESIPVPAGRAFSRPLPAGDYRLAVVCSRRNNRVDYTLTASTEELVAGGEREVDAPAEVPVAIGAAPLSVLDSLASDAVTAVLLDASHRVVARAGARDDDWGFLLAAALPPGTYKLRLEPLAGASHVRLSLRAPRETTGAPLAAPATRSDELADEVRFVPLAVDGGRSLARVAIAAPANVAAALEERAGDAWREIAAGVGRDFTLQAALAPADQRGALRLRLSPLDGGPVAVRLAAATPKAARASEAALAKGLVLGNEENGAAAAAVELASPGVFAFAEADPSVTVAGAPGALSPPGDLAVVAAGKTLWVAGRAGSRVRGARLKLALDAAPAKVRIPAATSAELETAAVAAPGPERLWLATARALETRPALCFAPAAGAPCAVAPVAGAALSAAIAPLPPRVAVFAAEPGAGRLDAEIAASARPIGAGGALADGVAIGVVPAGGALSFDLPAGAHQLAVTLGAGGVAVLAGAGPGTAIEAVLWRGAETLDEATTTRAARLILAGDAATGTPYRVSLFALPGGAAATTEPALDRSFAAAGRERIALPAGGGALHALGAVENLLWLTADGRVASGLDLAVSGAGTLLVDHGVGAALVWRESAGATSGSGPWNTTPAALELAAPANVALAGRDVVARVPVAAPGILEWTVEAPVYAELSGADGERRRDLSPAGLARATLVAPGTFELRLHALAGAALGGRLAVAWSPVVEIGEGLGPALALAPGGRRFAAFTVPGRRVVGVGVRATSSAVVAELYDGAGRRLASGVVAQRELEPGRYVLALSLPPDAAPAEARPAVVGLTAPPTTPPEEILRSYLPEPDAPAPE